MKKVTKRERYEAIISNYPLSVEDKHFLMHEIELLNKKNTAEKKPTAAQIANENFRNDIIDFLTETHGKFTIGEIWKNVPSLNEAADMTGQRVSSLITPLKKSGVILREEIKGKAYFSIA